MKVKKFRTKTDEECRKEGLPTPLEMVQQGIYFGPFTDELYMTFDEIEIDKQSSERIPD